MMRPPPAVALASILRTIACAAALACLGCQAGRGQAGQEIESCCYFDDGLRLLLAPDAGAQAPCVGANVRWDANDVYITLVSGRSASNAGVSHPSWLATNVRRYIFIPMEHVPAGAWVYAHVVLDGSVRSLGGRRRAEAGGPFPAAKVGP